MAYIWGVLFSLNKEAKGGWVYVEGGRWGGVRAGDTNNLNVIFLYKINKIKRNGNGRLNIIYVSPLS